MARLFVAVDLPDSVKDQLNRLKTNIPTARWVKPFQLHITLRFLGADVPEKAIDPIKDALTTVDAPAFELQLHGVGTFPGGKRKPPRVLWVGVKRQPELKRLYTQVEAVLEPLGYMPEDRKFSPHITLARFKTRQPLVEVAQFLSRHQSFHSDSYLVEQLVLYRSELSSTGPIYTKEQEYSLP